MQAIRVRSDEPGQPLAWEQVRDPSIGPNEVLVSVYAAGLNRADLSQRAGRYPPLPGASEILGLEMAGQIAALGPEVRGWRLGDRVCALLPGGGYAELAAVPQGMLMPVPRGWSYEQAAALPEVFLTAFLNIFVEAGFQPGETVLVHGGASGVGTAAVQLVHHAGGRVAVTVGTDEKAVRCRELGADLAINYKTEDFVERVRAFTGGAGVNIILDMVGATYLAGNVQLLGLRGRLVFIATLGGATAELNIAALMGRRLRLIGSVLRSRSLAEKTEITRRFMERFWPLVDAGVIQPVIDSVYPIQEAEAAQQKMAENRNIGKIVLKVK